MRERFAIIFSLLIMVTLVIGTWWAADYSQRAVDIDPPARKTHESDSWTKNFILLRTDAKGLVINRSTMSRTTTPTMSKCHAPSACARVPR